MRRNQPQKQEVSTFLPHYTPTEYNAAHVLSHYTDLVLFSTGKIYPCKYKYAAPYCFHYTTYTYNPQQNRKHLLLGVQSLSKKLTLSEVKEDEMMEESRYNRENFITKEPLNCIEHHHRLILDFPLIKGEWKDGMRAVSSSATPSVVVHKLLRGFWWSLQCAQSRRVASCVQWSGCIHLKNMKCVCRRVLCKHALQNV